MALVENPVDLPSHITQIKGPSETTTVTVESDINGSVSDNADTHFGLEEHPVDVVRPIKVGIIGAGLAGITAGVMLPAKLPGLDLRIYDKNADVGGTWCVSFR
jgi:heterodisulfide reductase subunit A-like polyferredoxin